ncbi:deoxyribodipyrimidine photo-lyase [Lentimicrobium sp.]|uniref:cryptochrome/photolyase family protein n=1 Tax=Lentimicrobium sp. TaxID=2034841 RepID=UPI00345F1464
MELPVNIFWFRRDLRLNDNHGLYRALQSGLPVLPVFIFDTAILNGLDPGDLRVNFIHRTISTLHRQLKALGSGLSVIYDEPVMAFEKLLARFQVKAVYTNHDYEPYARERDAKISLLLAGKGIDFRTFKDQVLFEGREAVKNDGAPYSVFTPYSRKWLELKNQTGVPAYPSESFGDKFLRYEAPGIPDLESMGFRGGPMVYPLKELSPDTLAQYASTRDIPGIDNTSRLGLHLRFGTISVRDCIKAGELYSATWLNELIWREFFMQILYHYPHVVKGAFKKEYDRIQWRNNEEEFKRWCEGTTGYPLVDAGMRQLNETGFMHNRARMVTAGFLTKHLLIDWRWGEAYFAARLLDFELSSNNGNWQCAAGSGCDAAPYFRIFNPAAQALKFDNNGTYIRRWIPEFDTPSYPRPVVEHSFARTRCMTAYSSALKP